MFNKPDRKSLRTIRRRRVRKKIYGTSERPRLNVFRSIGNIYAQIIDDSKGMTLVSASSLAPELKELHLQGNTNKASAVGRALAQKAMEAGIKTVVFDRAGYLYHGRIKTLAEAARSEGLEF